MKNVAHDLFPQIRGHYHDAFELAFHMGDAAELLHIDLHDKACRDVVLPHSWFVTGTEARMRNRSEFDAISLRGLHEMLLLSSCDIAKEYQEELAKVAEELLARYM